MINSESESFTIGLPYNVDFRKMVEKTIQSRSTNSSQYKQDLIRLEKEDYLDYIDYPEEEEGERYNCEICNE